MREQVGGVIKGPADAKTRKRENGVLFSLWREGDHQSLAGGGK